MVYGTYNYTIPGVYAPTNITYRGLTDTQLSSLTAFQVIMAGAHAPPLCLQSREDFGQTLAEESLSPRARCAGSRWAAKKIMLGHAESGAGEEVEEQ